MSKYQQVEDESVLEILAHQARWKSNTYSRLLPVLEMTTEHITNARKNVMYSRYEEYIGSFSSQLWYDIFTYVLEKRKELSVKISDLNSKKANLLVLNGHLIGEKAELQRKITNIEGQIYENRELIESIAEELSSLI